MCAQCSAVPWKTSVQSTIHLNRSGDKFCCQHVEIIQLVLTPRFCNGANSSVLQAHKQQNSTLLYRCENVVFNTRWIISAHSAVAWISLACQLTATVSYRWPAAHGPVWIPMRSLSVSRGRCRIVKCNIWSSRSSAILQISAIWRPALGFGNPLTTTYASPMISTWQHISHTLHLVSFAVCCILWCKYSLFFCF